MTNLELAKRRAARRHDEGGAAMFIVAMTLAVLASVGVFALAAASTEVRMSGNERQSTQTHYLSEYGILGMTRELAPTKTDSYVGMMVSATDTCLALSNVPATAPPLSLECRRFHSQEMSQTWNSGVNVIDSYGGKAPYASHVTPGSFGVSPMDADFFVEVTDLQIVKAPNNSDRCTNLLTVTSYGVTRPLYPGLSNTVTTSYGAEGVEVQRARVAALGSCAPPTKAQKKSTTP
jgi:hypothetical protein